MGNRFEPSSGTARRKGVDNWATDFGPTTIAEQVAADGWLKTDRPVGEDGQITPECGNYPLGGMAGAGGDGNYHVAAQDG